MLSQWLPYRSFDRKTDIFFQTNSIAFALEVAPLMGADERTGEIIAQLLSENIPAGHSASDSDPTPVVECKPATRAPLVWLAPTPVPFITDKRYSRRDKL